MSKQNKQLPINAFSMAIISFISLIISIIGIFIFAQKFNEDTNLVITIIGIIISINISFLAITDVIASIIVIHGEKREDVEVKKYILSLIAMLKDSLFYNIIFLTISSIVLLIFIVISLIL